MSTPQEPRIASGTGAPPEATTRPLRHDDLWSISIPSDPQLSPDGQHVAYVVTTPDRERDDYRSSIWTVPAEGGEPRLLTCGPRDLSPRWSPDGRWLAFLAARLQGEPPQLHMLSLAGGEPSRLTNLPGGAGESVWSPDGSCVAFAAPTNVDDEENDGRPVVVRGLGYKADGTGLLKGVRTQLFVMDDAIEQVPSAPSQPRQLTFGERSVSSPVWSPDGLRLAYACSRVADGDHGLASVVHTISAAGGKPVALSPADAVYQVADWSPDGEMILLVGQQRPGAGNDNLCTVPATGGEPVRLSPMYDRAVVPGMPAAPGAMPRYVDGGARVLFCASDGGAVHVLEVSAAGGAPSVLIGGDRVVAGMSALRDRVAFVAADVASPGEVWIRDRSERVLSELFASALPEVRLLAPMPMRFNAPEGTELHGWVLRGDAQEGGPLLVDIHGGPQSSWGAAFDGCHIYQQTLAAAGWVVLTLNPRASDGYGDALRTATVGAWGHADEADFLAAIDDLVDRGIADPERLCVGGYSYGGYMTCWLTARSDRFAAAVSGGCVCDLVSMVGTSDLGRFIADVHLRGSVVGNRESLVQSSPLTHVAGVTTPTLILHGEDDQRCSVGQSEEWFSALRELNVPVQFVRYPGQSHLYTLNGRPSHRIDYGRRLESWLTTWTNAATRQGRYEGQPTDRSGSASA